MIRPYLTVLIDSFHEAFASRVLWILLLVNTLLLGALVPLGLQEQRASRLQTDSIRDWPALIGHIKQDADREGASPGRRIWELAGDDFRQSITESTRKERPNEFSWARVPTLLEELNHLLANPKFYDKAAWANVNLDRKTSDLVAKGIENLPQDELVLLNRQLLKAAFPAEIASMPNEELALSYFGRRFGSPFPVSRKLAEPIINQILAGVMNFFVGSIAVFAAILVTSTIIPQTFEAGAIDLLLSKPVARSMLFLVKFFGGCAFILLNGGYFVVGLWAIMGLRFGLWNHRLLLCIPLFMFLFVIYYSVSALAAVLWKNAIVSVVITILFWAACFTVGTAKGVIEQLFINPNRIVNVVSTDAGLVAVNESGELHQWRSGAWESVMKAERHGGPPFAGGPLLIGPVYDPSHKQLLFTQRLSSRHFRLLGPTRDLKTLTWSDGAWIQDVKPAPPTGTSWLFVGPRNEITVVGTAGIFRLNEKPAQKETKILGFTIPTGGDGPYIPLGPKPALSLDDPFAAAMNPISGDLVMYGSGTLRYLRRDKDGKYTRGPERKLDNAEPLAALAFAGTNIVLAQQDGRVLVLGAGDLQTRKELQPVGKSEPYVAKATPDGRWFAVLFHDGTLVLLDADGNQRTTLGKTVSAVAFEGNESMLVADRTARVTKYSLPSLRAVDRYEPALDMLEASYRYFILPFYTIFPKPGELGNVVSYLLTDEKTIVPSEEAAPDLRQARIKIDVLGPVLSSLAFVAVVLGLTCVYVARADF